MTQQEPIQVEVKLYASHRIGRFKKARLAYPPGTSVGEGLKALGIAEASLGLALVNGQRARFQQLLCDGDTLAVFPRVSGG